MFSSGIPLSLIKQKSRKNVGPRGEQWDTLVLIPWNSEEWLFTTNLINLRNRKDLIIARSFPEIPENCRVCVVNTDATPKDCIYNQSFGPVYSLFGGLLHFGLYTLRPSETDCDIR